MNQIWMVLVPTALALVGARIALANSKSRASAFVESAEHVLIRRQRGWILMAVLVVLTSVPLIAQLPEAAGHETPGVFFAGSVVFFSIMGSGFGLLAYALRKIYVDREGVRIVGVASGRYPWGALRELEATVEGRMGCLKFVFADKTIRVDSTFDGFRGLVRALEVWPTGNAAELGRKAAAVLVEWREDPK